MGGRRTLEGNRSLLVQILSFSLPLAATGMLQTLFNSIDMMVVGRFASSSALAAVGSSSTLVKLLICGFQGLTVGADILIARCVGSRKEDRIHRSVHCAIALSLVLGIFAVTVGLSLSAWLLKIIATPQDIMEPATVYFRLYILGLPAQMVYNFGSAALRAKGETKKPFYFLLCSGSGHIVMNLLFVAWLQMGVAGAGLATCITQYVSASLILGSLMRDRGAVQLQLRKLRLYKEEALELLRIGFPAGVQAILFQVSVVSVQSVINSLGSTVIAANTAARNVDVFNYTAMNSVSFAASTLTSRELGAGNRDQVSRIFRNCALAVLLIGVPLSLINYFFAEPLLSIFVSRSDPAYEDIIYYGTMRLVYLGLPYILCGLMESFGAMVRGIGHSWPPMVVSIFGLCALRIAWVHFVFPLSPTLENLYLSYPVSWLVTMAAHLVCFAVLYRRDKRRGELN